MAIVSLRDVVEALDLQSEELRSYLDPVTGEVITFNLEEAEIAERGEWERAPEWMKPSLPKIKRALKDNHLLALPDRIHIDEWRMMQDFVSRDELCQCRAELESTVHGEAAFSRFKDAVRRLGLEDEWFRYREAEYARVAREWLEQNKIPYR